MRGILNINKPIGITSFDVIARLRKILNMKKIGHAGTLDPLAEGVLPIFIGKATRLIQFAPKTKSYRAYARLGIETNTYDTEGEILSKKIIEYNLEDIKNILKSFEGKILQKPPIYSAISVNAKRLYEYARKNQEVEIPTREVEIYNLEVVEFDESSEFPLLVFDIYCASGVYVRSIIHDLGEKLGSGAMMENLTRTMSANLKLEDSVRLQDLTSENAKDFIIDPCAMLEMESLELSAQEYDKILKGQFLVDETNFGVEENIKLIFENKLVAIAQKKDNLIKPKVVVA